MACDNHLLNSEVNKMYENTRENGAGKSVDSIQETMLAMRGSIKNSACLLIETPLNAILGGRTKWTNWITMMNRYVKIRQELIKASDHEDANIPIDCTLTFKEKNVPKFLMRSSVQQYHYKKDYFLKNTVEKC